MEWLVLLLIALAALGLIYYLLSKLRGGPAISGWGAPGWPRTRALSTRPPVEEDQYGVLLNMVLGDRQKAERLIAFEERRAPGASRARLIQNAIDRLRDDYQR